VTPFQPIEREKLITFGQAAQFIDDMTAGSFRPNVSTIHRWALRGVKGRRLEVRRIGRKWFTSAEAVRRFIDRHAAPEHHGEASPAAPSEKVALPSTRVVEEFRRRLFRDDRTHP
jgi:Protein of unknown function (DUF1580)